MRRKRGTVWLVDDDPPTCRVLERALQAAGLSTVTFEVMHSAIQALCVQAPDVLIVGLQFSEAPVFELLRRVRTTHTRLPVIVMTPHCTLRDALLSYRAGAFWHLPKPIEIHSAMTMTRRALDTRRYPTGEAVPIPAAVPEVLGRAPAMQPVFRAISCLSRSSATVLITGEAGTGKELVARSLHDHSPRSSKPFIAVNAGAIAPDLLESELFGNDRVGYPGYAGGGRFQQAHGGTLFIDAIGELTPTLQARLLRVLADGHIQPHGSQIPVHVDVRVIAATSENLYDRVADGRLRKDLYYHLDVIRIEVPPLRARKEDIAELLGHFGRIAATELGVAPKCFSEQALAKLLSYEWPGNNLELVNLCWRLCAMSADSQVREEDLPLYTLPACQPAQIHMDWSRALAAWADREAENPTRPLIDAAQPEFERVLIRGALRNSGGRRQQAAALIGWGRNTLTRKLKELNLRDYDTETLQQSPAAPIHRY